ncbi:MAG TPA: hypothetical protein DDY49_03385 [Paenibacillaceae bacterium]|nr:hypothetical protein [Paenibacillaceae bacterium]
MIDEYQKLELVQDLFDQEQFEEGYAFLEQLEEEYASNEDMLFEIGVFYYDVGHIDKSLTIFRKVEPLVRGDEEFLYECRLYQSSALIELGKMDEALDLLMVLKEEKEGEEDSRLYSLLGQLYRIEGLSEVAIGYFQKALSFNPDHKEEILYWLGELYEESGEDQKALDIWKGISGFTEEEEFLVKSANLEARRGEFEKAKALFEKAIEISVSPEALFGCGIVCYQMGDWTSAVRRFSQLIEKDPEYVAAYPLLGEALWELKLKDQAIAVYNQVLGIQSEDIHLVDRFLMLLTETGRWQEVKDYIGKMHDIDEEDPILFYWKGRIAEKEGNIRDAIALYQKVQMGEETIHDTIQRLNNII